MAVSSIAFLGFCVIGVVISGHVSNAHNTVGVDSQLVLLLVNQSAKLLRLEQRLEQQDSQLKQQDSELAQLKRQQTAGLQKMAEQVDSLQNGVDLNGATLLAMNATLTKQGTTVAFHALKTNGNFHVAKDGPLVFNHAETNVGRGFNTHTGVFTAPVSGVYFFQTTFLGQDSKDYFDAAIFVHGRKVAEGVSDNRFVHRDTTTITAVVHVTSGHSVYVHNLYKPNVYLPSPYTTFSGFLLRAD